MRQICGVFEVKKNRIPIVVTIEYKHCTLFLQALELKFYSNSFNTNFAQYNGCIQWLQRLESNFQNRFILLMTDLLLDNTGDLKFENGDFATGFSDNQHQQHILLANKGEFKEFPEIGVGIVQMLADDEYTDVLIEAKKNLQYDGMKINNIKFEQDGKLNIYGSY